MANSDTSKPCIGSRKDFEGGVPARIKLNSSCAPKTREEEMKVIASILILLTIGVSAYAADVDGTWTGSVSSPQGEFPVSFTFKADGATLTGSTLGFDGMPVPIRDGKIDSNTITFTVTFDFG